MFATLLLAPAAFAANQYFSSASGGTLWDNTGSPSSSYWATTTGGSYVNAWIDGNTANFEGTAGTVTVGSGANSPTSAGVNISATNYVFSGGEIILTGTGNIGFVTLGSYPGTNTISSAISVSIPLNGGTNGVIFQGFGGNTFNYIVNGASTFTNQALVRACNVIFDTMPTGGVPGPFGMGDASTPIVVCQNASYAYATYTGSGAGTDRPFTTSGTGGQHLYSSGTGPMRLNNTGNSCSGTFAARSINLKGTYTASANTYAQKVNDLTGFSTSLTISGNTWLLTGANAHTGGTKIDSSGVLQLTNDVALGNAANALTFTGSGTLAAVNNGAPVQNDVTIASTRTITVNATFTGSFATPDTNNLIIAAKITGAGAVKKANSSFSQGTVRFSSDTSDYTGDFTAGFGNTEFTSVGNAGVASSLGAGANININNSVSTGTLRYVGTASSSTTRPLVWAGNGGAYTLDNTNTGTMAYLATASLRSGNGSAILTLSGSNPGANTLAPVINDSADAQPTSLVKSGANQWVLTGANTYSGNTTISAGTLALSGSGTVGTNNLIISGGATFDVSGVGGGYALTAGQTLVATNGAIATINGSLNATSASVLMTNVINTPTINVTGGALTLGSGTLFTVNVNNGGTPLGAGSYKLISLGGGGSVVGTAPAAVTVGGDGLAGGVTASLAITSSELYLNVVGGATPSTPVISGIGITGGQAVMTFSGTNGTWYLLSTTNLTLPLSAWVTNATGTFSSLGSIVNWTNPSPTAPQEFYRIKSQ